MLIKGGHLPTPMTSSTCSYDRHEFRSSAAPRVASTHTHGTGCTFAAAITAHLALGHALDDAVPRAQRYVADAIRHAPGLGRGHGPMDHFWKVSGDGLPAAL